MNEPSGLALPGLALAGLGKSYAGVAALDGVTLEIRRGTWRRETLLETYGHAAEAVAFGTEAPYLNQIGLQTIVLGPGDIDQAHQPDEYLALDRIKPAQAIVTQLVERFCF